MTYRFMGKHNSDRGTCSECVLRCLVSFKESTEITPRQLAMLLNWIGAYGFKSLVAQKEQAENRIDDGQSSLLGFDGFFYRRLYQQESTTCPNKPIRSASNT